MQIMDIVQAAHIRETKEKMIIEAFGSWQIIEAIKGIMGGSKAKGQKFNDYLKGIGLAEKIRESKQVIDQKRQQALSIAGQIKALDQQQGGKMNGTGSF